MEANVGVRKGAWTEEEDAILRNCIEKYGEGNWHQIPYRAGLNRCRKSCRLRWLNYLKPNINRGVFQEDEVDLIFRLHKLLGNRWSLIAGRLPGRTANDVKNYWNTHIKKKNVAFWETMHGDKKHTSNNTSSKVEVIKPRPRTFKNFSRMTARETTRAFFSSDFSILPSDNFNSTPKASHQTQPVDSCENETNWWESLLFDNQLVIAEQGDTAGADITKSVVAEDAMEGVACDQICSQLDAVAEEDWHCDDWSIDVLNSMALNCFDIFDGVREKMGAVKVKLSRMILATIKRTHMQDCRIRIKQ
ncbi:hypothetical protein SAY87_010795 [Trapa incisa]|uniref:Uncharacterized protein n=1 Tax=Trapa incisa TaxID=236973 RepID=A0AAN7GQ06_9MYRT|nr:hypothetical protein SAY87_010795 [Trapa incisa]